MIGSIFTPRQEAPMIVELVTFALPAGWTRDQEAEALRGVVPKWQANPELWRKHFLWGLGDDAGTGGGLYIWPSIEAAQRAHDAAWREGVKARTGGDPTSRYFDLMALVDNEAGTVTEWPAAEAVAPA
jgi:hypothetical protein